MPKKTAIVVHHTWSYWGAYRDVHAWHTDPPPQGRGWSDIGYHKLIYNQYPTYQSWATRKPVPGSDGKIVDGRKPETSVGAHCKEQGMNSKSIGVSLIGNFDGAPPGEKQWDALVYCCAVLCIRHGIDSSAIYYHRDFADKTCPGTKFPTRANLRKAVHDKIVEMRKDAAE